MLGPVVTALYRLTCLVGYGYVAFWTVENLRDKATASFNENIIIQSRFLTFDTLLVQVVYFFLALLLMPTKCVKVKSMLACVAATTGTVVSVTFWSIYFRDINLLANVETMRDYPVWHMHVTHSLVALTAILDIILSRPTSLPYFRTLLLLLVYYGGYALYTEWIISTQKAYAYPMLKALSTSGRIRLYGIVCAGALIVFLACSLFIKVLSVGQRRKTKKEKVRNKKPDPSASPKPKTSPQATTGKKAKQKKQD
uniref:FAR-17a/AIG1-like protein n=1 Tax=Schistocephalus solidus TaxID=70667 RepID=A0A0X3PW18_SCHSO